MIRRVSRPTLLALFLLFSFYLLPFVLAKDGDGGDDDNDHGGNDDDGGGDDDDGDDNDDDDGGGPNVMGNITSTFMLSMNGQNLSSIVNNGGSNFSMQATAPLLARGIHIQFEFDPVTFGVFNYTLTGAVDPQRLVTQPTTIFTSQVPTSLSASELTNPTIARLVLNGDQLLVTLCSPESGVTITVQASDLPQGGLLQIEPETAENGTVEFTRTLAPALFYFEDDGDVNEILFGSGDSSTPSLVGRDSPQAANKTFQDGMTTEWLVQSGGGIGIVLGQDALGANTTQCDTDCQDMDKIHGTLPVAPVPSNVTPLAGGPASATALALLNAAKVKDVPIALLSMVLFTAFVVALV